MQGNVIPMTDFEPALRWIDSQKERMVALIREWAEINTHTDNLEGIARFIDRLKEDFSSLEGEISEVPLPPRQIIHDNGAVLSKPVGNALSIRKRTKAPFQVLLSAHLDTVFPANSHFQSCSDLGENRIQGPGVIDIKGGIALMLIALEAFEKFGNREALGWEIFFSPDEEVGSPSSASELAKRAAKHDVGLVFEPPLPDGAYVSERMASANITISVDGFAAHVGRDFSSGKNAILLAIPLIQEIQNYALAHDQLILNLGRIHGGVSPNVVPEKVVMHLNLRSSSPSGIQEALVAIEHLVDLYQSKHSIPCQFYLNNLRPVKPFDSKTRQLFEQVKTCAELLNLPVDWRKSGGVCDGNILAAAGLPTIDTLGVEGNGMHTPKEFIKLSRITVRTALTTLLLYAFSNRE